jgi:ketosteroid isomerase-like protein
MQVWPRDGALRVIDGATVEALRRHWEDGWNQADVDLICEPFADDVVFSSPFVPRIVGDPDVWDIRGIEAVRRYVADSFERATQGIRYRCDHAHAGTDCVILAYTVLHPAGERLGADLMRLGDEGRVVEWRCHYPFDG